MFRAAFPVCPVEGEIDPPIPYSHGASRGAVPHKCGQCKFLFEGSCTRAIENIRRYLDLDYGFCGIAGATNPVTVHSEMLRDELAIPQKCTSCSYLKTDRIRGFVCKKDENKWGDFTRGLDWADWKPDIIYLSLPFPKITTKELSVYAKNDDLIAFIKEYRRINSGISLAEVNEDYHKFQSILHTLQ